MTPRDANSPWPGPDGWTVQPCGGSGRYVVLINNPADDPSIWWPLAADLARGFRPIIVQPPVPAMPQCLGCLSVLADDLTVLLRRAGGRRPIVVGQGRSALAASLFGARHAVGAVLNIEQPLYRGPNPCREPDPREPGERRAAGSPRCSPACTTCSALTINGRTQAGLLAALRWTQAPYLSVFRAVPWRGYPDWLRTRIPTSQVVIYGSDHDDPRRTDIRRCVAGTIRRVAG